MRPLQILLCVLLILGTLKSLDGVKILAIFPFPGPSQYINVLPYLKALAARGHELTVVNAFPQKTPIPNFRDIPVMKVHETYAELIREMMIPHNKWELNTVMTDFAKNISLDVLHNPEFQSLLKPHVCFDLIIIEALRNDALYALANHYNAPIIGFSTFGTDWHIDELVGNTSPLSYIPTVTEGFTDRMNFWERIQNFATTSIEWLHGHLIQIPVQNELFLKYFPHIKEPLSEIRKNFSLILLNQHFSLSYPRPYVPNMIEVGGLHISHKPAPLPTDIAEFIDGAEHGVIYFSMGSNVKSKDLPPKTREAILKVFGVLKQRVLWKFEDDQLPGKPSNVFISKWFPQPDILAHPKVKLFITHAGLLSTIESIYHGKPILGLPVFYDQFLNVKRAVLAGFGLRLDFINLNDVDFKRSIERLLTEPSFTKVATDMSKRYRDQPMSPLDTAVWWTEYVLRHKGATHMRSTAQDLSFIAYHSLDSILVLSLALILVLSIPILIIYKIFAYLGKADVKKTQKVKTK